MSHSILTFEEAKAVFYFQMNGYLVINKLTSRNYCNDWKKVQKTIYAFIKAELESFNLQFIFNKWIITIKIFINPFIC